MAHVPTPTHRRARAGLAALAATVNLVLNERSPVYVRVFSHDERMFDWDMMAAVYLVLILSVPSVRKDSRPAGFDPVISLVARISCKLRAHGPGGCEVRRVDKRSRASNKFDTKSYTRRLPCAFRPSPWPPFWPRPPLVPAALAQEQSPSSSRTSRSGPCTQVRRADCAREPADTEKGTGSVRTEDARQAKITDADIVTAPVFERKSVTHHTVTIDGKSIPYTATAGTLTLRDDQGKPIASMFYVAYTADARNANRPVTFFYNGGPGSASLWLHMGSFGPVRVHTDSPDPTHNAPFTFENNNESLLDKTDMVFLDAVGAGYSRPLGDTKGDKFYGVDQDIDAFTRGIKRYITINDRWNSPKYLFGESYGTTRSAGLSYSLQEAGVQLNGVMLLSSILNYSIRAPGYDRLYVGLRARAMRRQPGITTSWPTSRRTCPLTWRKCAPGRRGRTSKP